MNWKVHVSTFRFCDQRLGCYSTINFAVWRWRRSLDVDADKWRFKTMGLVGKECSSFQEAGTALSIGPCVPIVPCTWLTRADLVVVVWNWWMLRKTTENRVMFVKLRSFKVLTCFGFPMSRKGGGETQNNEQTLPDESKHSPAALLWNIQRSSVLLKMSAVLFPLVCACFVFYHRHKRGTADLLPRCYHTVRLWYRYIPNKDRISV